MHLMSLNTTESLIHISSSPAQTSSNSRFVHPSSYLTSPLRYLKKKKVHLICPKLSFYYFFFSKPAFIPVFLISVNIIFPDVWLKNIVAILDSSLSLYLQYKSWPLLITIIIFCLNHCNCLVIGHHASAIVALALIQFTSFLCTQSLQRSPIKQG